MLSGTAAGVYELGGLEWITGIDYWTTGMDYWTNGLEYWITHKYAQDCWLGC